MWSVIPAPKSGPPFSPLALTAHQTGQRLQEERSHGLFPQWGWGLLSSRVNVVLLRVPKKSQGNYI